MKSVWPWLVAAAVLVMVMSTSVNGCNYYNQSLDLTGVRSFDLFGTDFAARPYDFAGVDLRPSGTWVTETTNTSTNLISVFATDSTVYVGGEAGTLLRSVSGGNTWNALTTPFSGTVRGIWGSSDINMFLVSDDGIYHSIDGLNWDPQDSGITEILTAIWGAAPNDVYAVGTAGSIVHTTDGGNTWFSMGSPVGVDLYGVWGVSTNNVYAVGANGTILHGNGSGWNIQNSAVVGNLYSVWGPSATTAYIVGADGVALITQNSGASWGPLLTTVSNSLLSVGGSGADIWAVGDNGIIIHSSDNGLLWTNELITPPTSAFMQAVHVHSQSEVWAVGYEGVSARRK
jgi:photosystem II stability/assembly factor-like uncharacterized protein